MPLADGMNFGYRMGAGFEGDVTRMTPAAIIEPCASHQAAPPTQFGQAVMIDATTGGARPVTTGDTAAYGITVRGFPMQQANASGYFGASDFGTVAGPFGIAGQPPAAVDVLRQGYMNVKVVGTARKGGQVFVWIGATGGGHTNGGFETVTGGASTITLPGSCTYQGAADANGITEIAFNIGP